MKTGGNAKKLIKELSDTTSADMDDRTVKDILGAMHQSAKGKPDLAHASFWKYIMESRLTRLTAAAVMIVAVIFGLFEFGIFPGGANVALGEVAAHLRMARTVTYKMTVEKEGQEPLATFCMHLEPNRVRIESCDGTIAIADTYLGKSLVLKPADKIAYTMNTVVPSAQISDLYDEVKQNVLGNFQTSSVQDIGEDTIDGRRVTGFLLKQAHIEVVIWADVRTAVPVLIEFVGPFGALVASDEHGRSTKVIFSDLVLGQELDEALFSLRPPEGYIIEETRTPISPSHSQLIRRMSVRDMQALHALCWKFAEAHNGEWPDSLQAAVEWGTEVSIKLGQFQALLALKDPEAELGLRYVKPGQNYRDMLGGRDQERVLVLYHAYDEWPASGIWVTYLDGHVKQELDETRFRNILEFSESRCY
jgi:outer membrane lipoprotein-sorting protein